MNGNNANQGAAKKKRLRLNALDVMLIAVLITCVVAFGLKLVKSREINTSTTDAMEDYIVSFSVSNIRYSSLDYFNEGDKFYIMDEKGKNPIYLGELEGKGSDGSHQAQTYYTQLDGTPVLVTNSSDEMDSTNRYDMNGDLRVQGIKKSDGFYVGGTTYLGINKELEIKSKYIVVNVKITGIEKAPEKG